MDRYIGKLLDNRYEILEKIGSGGMADVYKARCHRLNRLVAIKILKEDLSQDAEFRRRFHAESQAVAMRCHTRFDVRCRPAIRLPSRPIAQDSPYGLSWLLRHLLPAGNASRAR